MTMILYILINISPTCRNSSARGPAVTILPEVRLRQLRCLNALATKVSQRKVVFIKALRTTIVKGVLIRVGQVVRNRVRVDACQRHKWARSEMAGWQAPRAPVRTRGRAREFESWGWCG